MLELKKNVKMIELKKMIKKLKSQCTSNTCIHKNPKTNTLIWHLHIN
jgi:translation initiation factor 1 (eIF-1/SUI1)